MENMKFSDILKKYIPRDYGARTDLAKKVGVTLTYIIDLASDRKKPPTITRCRQIADALRLTKDQTVELIMAAALERIDPEELEVIRSVQNNIGSCYEHSSIKGTAPCPYCKKKISVEIDKTGEVLITGVIVDRLEVM